ncbi:MAG TPA: hypothetical protein VMU89_12645 [Thermomicrobiaceae bacterium]|nr:hypothetical protein [Thermomicrobiaceae bacterium]
MPQARKHTPRRGSRRRPRPLMLGLVALIAVAAVVAVALLGRGGTSNPTQASAGPEGWSVASYTGGPRLAVDRTNVDGGAVPYEHAVSATFRLKNVGDRALTLQPPGPAQVLDGC